VTSGTGGGGTGVKGAPLNSRREFHWGLIAKGGWREDRYSGKVDGGLVGLMGDGQDTGHGAGGWCGSEAGASALGGEGAVIRAGVADWDHTGR
jgi:hypothetical protein